MRTGAAPSRGARASQLLLYWQSRRLSLDADTGQVGRFYLPTVVGAPTIDGRTGNTAQAGHGMPRWEQTTAMGLIPRLSLIGDNGAKDVERLEWDHLLKVMATSMYVKVWPGYTAGSDVGAAATKILLSFGSATTGGGLFALRRINATWQGYRARAAATLSSVVTEAGSAAFPMELLVTLSAGGVIQTISRDASGALVTGATATDTNMMIGTENWGTNLVYSQGGNYWLETIKIARGVQTFASMDLLS